MHNIRKNPFARLATPDQLNDLDCLLADSLIVRIVLEFFSKCFVKHLLGDIVRVCQSHFSSMRIRDGARSGVQHKVFMRGPVR